MNGAQGRIRVEREGGRPKGVGPAEERADWPDRLWTHEETARWLHISVWTLHHVVSRGEGPPVYLVARRARRYDPNEVQDWVRGQRIPPGGPIGPDENQMASGDPRRVTPKAA